MDLRRSKAVLATPLVALALILLALSPPASSGLAFADPLRSWEADSTGQQGTEFFRLDPGEGYSTYLFHIEPGDGVPVGVALVEVRNLDGGLECRGLTTYTLDTLNALHYCPEIRVGHHYELKWVADRAGTELTLSGSND